MASSEDEERAKLHSFLEILAQESGIRHDGSDARNWHTKNQNTNASPQNSSVISSIGLGAEEGHENQESKSFLSSFRERSETPIEGSVTSQGFYKTDNEDICELYINKEGSDTLPHECGQKRPISLTIGDTTFKAGVHETQEGVVWLSSVLYKKGIQKEKVRLVDVLAGIGLKKGDRIRIQKNIDGTFSLSGIE